ncbi:unnamed protein product [Auanema sp. JU1783]|nr:unnamed protein product [Auanema sp. JU1783]
MAHETIHSGHFMTSNPHTDPAPDDEDEDVEVDVVEDDDKPDNNNSTSKAVLEEKPVTFYKFGPKKTQSIAIDVSLNKLNKCIKVAYNKMTTPKWKDFKGLRLHWKQRIRLNNVIWRAYYIEFVRNRNKPKPKRTPFCYFAVPDDDTTHMKIEGSLLEGMYWKRKMEAVCAQYKRWRHFIKTRRSHFNRDRPLQKRKIDNEIRHSSADEPCLKIPRSQTPKNNVSNEFYDEDDYENSFTDSLFESLNQPYMFPNPREMMQSGNADIMQPGLLSLQPSLEEIMASLDDPQRDPGSVHSTSSLMFQSPSSNIPPQTSSHPMRLRASPSSSTPPLPQLVVTSPSSAKLRMGLPNHQVPVPRQNQEYAMASMLLDYSSPSPSSIQMPTRQSSSITSQMLMLSAQGVQPQYSTATYDQRPWKPSNFLFEATANVANQVDYIPQFLQSQASMVQGTQTMSTSTARAWWMDAQIGQSPLQASSVGPSTPLGIGNSNRVEESNKTPVHLNRGDNVNFSMKEFQEEDKSFSPHLSNKDWLRIAASPYSQSSTSSHQPAPPTVSNSRPAEPLQINQWKGSPIDPSTSIYPSYGPSLNPTPPQDEGPLARAIREETKFPNPISKGEMTVFKEEPMTGPPSVKMGRSNSRQVPADSTLHPEERKRILHLHAEQNRRSALKDGFDQLMELIPDLYSGGVKPTNAVVLAKSAEHIRRLNQQKSTQETKAAALKEKIAKLTVTISSLQSNLPSSSGIPSTSKVEPLAAMEGFYDRYTKEKSKTDWRFWIMSRMLQNVIVGKPNSFSHVLSQNDSSSAELAASCSDWLNKQWRGPELRPLASTLLVHLATHTNVLTSPASLADYVKDQMKNPV